MLAKLIFYSLLTQFKLHLPTYAKYDSSKKTYTTVSDIKEATHIQLTSKSNASQGSDVPTKIQLVFTDNFNYEVDVTMNTPFTMTFQQQ